MAKRYTLPTVTVDGQDTSVGVLVDDEAKLREWLHDARRCVIVDSFRFRWAEDPRSTEFPLLGHLGVLWYYQGGLYIKLNLCYGGYYRDVLYPIDEFCRMLFKSTRPAFGWCITVTVQ